MPGDHILKMNNHNQIIRKIDEDPLQVQRHIKHLKELLKKDKALFAPTDDAFLLKFLRSMKFDCLETFKLIQRHYQRHIEYPEIFLKVPPSEHLVIIDSKAMSLLPKRDQYGRLIIVGKLGVWDPRMVAEKEALRAVRFCVEAILMDEETQKNGIVVIGDFQGFSWRQALYFRPYIFRIFLRVFYEGMPARYDAFHIVNTGVMSDFGYRLCQGLLDEEVRRKVFIHGRNWQALHKYIDPSVLPTEYNGTMTSEDNDQSDFINKVLRYDEKTKYGYISNETR